MNKNNDIEVSSFRLTKNSIEPIGNPTFAQWQELGLFIKKAKGAVHFWIGDWLNYGETRWGKEHEKELEAEYNYDYETLRGDKWVASRIPNVRRRTELSFDHHKTVASLEPDEQERLLGKAAKEKLDNQSFRKLVRSYNLKVELPEFTPEMEKEMQKQEPQFDQVQDVLDHGIIFLESLMELKIDELGDDPRDFLLSDLKKTIGMLSAIVQKYDPRQKRLSLKLESAEPT